MQIITDVKAINAQIKSIAVRGAKLDLSIWETGVNCINHASEHGDTTLLDALCNALPKGSRKLAFVEWVLAHAQVRVIGGKSKEEKLQLKQGRVFALDRDRTLNLEGAMTTAWYEFKPEAPVQTAFDLQASVTSLIKKYEKAVSEGLSIEHKEEAKVALLALLEKM